MTETRTITKEQLAAAIHAAHIEDAGQCEHYVTGESECQLLADAIFAAPEPEYVNPQTGEQATPGMPEQPALPTRCNLCGGPHLSASVHSSEELRVWEADREQRLATARRVSAHTPHDRNGPPDKASEFPTCSECGAILTEQPALDVER